jgi:NAD(P)-dependent dehydrogenase (short-subunit alcohol dehydrogenase family)
VRVALFDLNAEKGEALARELGGVFCQVNVTSEAEVEAGFARARAALGQERILVVRRHRQCHQDRLARQGSAGPDPLFRLDAFERIIQINLIGSFRCLARSAAGMLTLDARDGDRGVIINTASVAAQDGQMGQAAYAASKAGVVGMTLPIARDLAGEGIRVNTIMPGIFNTPLLQGAQERRWPRCRSPSGSASPPNSSLALEMCRNSYFNRSLDGAIRMAALSGCLPRSATIKRTRACSKTERGDADGLQLPGHTAACAAPFRAAGPRWPMRSSRLTTYAEASTATPTAWPRRWRCRVGRATASAISARTAITTSSCCWARPRPAP